MEAQWLRGPWRWPPMESDPALFQALARKLLTPAHDGGVDAAAPCAGGNETAVALQHELLGKDAQSVAPLLPLRIDEVFSFGRDDVEANRGARAFLVCYHNQPAVSGGLQPAVAAAVAANAATVETGIFVKQTQQLDAACGLIGLIHALLNADGMLGPSGAHLPVTSPLGGWRDALPASATPKQRGSSLADDACLRAVYAAEAARGQSRMPCSPYWTVLGIILITLWLASLAAVVVLSFWRGFSFLILYFVYSVVVEALVFLGYAFYRYCGGPLPAQLECHFVCMAARDGRVLLLDGTQEGVKDVGACGADGSAFAEVGLAFVRDKLLPALARSNTCAIMALSSTCGA